MPKVKKIDGFTDLFEKAVGLRDKSFLSYFIPGHLMVEFLLVKIVEIKMPTLKEFVESLNHQKLIELAHGLGVITDDMKISLAAINRMRNKLAHDLTYEPSITEYRDLTLLAKTAFSDFTDGIEQTLAELDGKVSIDECEEFIFPELFMQVSYDLHEIYQELGGDVEDFH